MSRNPYFIRSALSVLLGAVPGVVAAQGYQIDELSARRLGDAFSGGAAEARDASTAYYNPAGLTRLKQTEFVAGVSVITSQVDFEGTAITADPADTSSSGAGFAPVSGRAASTKSDDPVPNFYVAVPLREGRTLGFAVNAPFASSTNYGDDSILRYQSVSSEITGVRFTLGLGQEISPGLSVGGGVVAQQLSGTLRNALDTASYCSIGYALSGGMLPTCGTAGTSAQDGRVTFTGYDMAFGYTLGLLYSFDDQSRFGFAWRSEIKHDLDGNAEVSMPGTLGLVTSQIDPFLASHVESASFSITTPESASFSLFHPLGEKFSVQADATWTRWSRFEKLEIETASGFAVTQQEDWDDVWRFALGGEYQASERWAWRAGIASDRSPVPENRRNVAFPLDDFLALSLGVTWQMSPALALDAGLQKTMDFDSDISDGDVATTFAQAQGTSDSSTWSAAIGLNWKH